LKNKPLILLIDTSSENQFLAIAENDKVLYSIFSSSNKNFSLHGAINNICSNSNIQLSHIDAISVIEGPGSYTGLRVGMATAKGLCYALNKPLLTISALEVLAKTVIDDATREKADLFCPMIDARRNEVFTAIYDSTLTEKLSPQALILDGNSFNTYTKDKKVLFLGSGAEKWKEISDNPIFFYLPAKIEDSFAALSSNKLNNRLISNVITSEPVYLKDFYSSK